MHWSSQTAIILNPKQQLTKLVHLLHSCGHVFAADPEPITKLLRHDSLLVAARLVKRAELIDSNHALRQRLQRPQNQLCLLLLATSALLFVTGFTTTLALITSANINFFYLLLSILGLNSVMLLLRLLFTFIPGHLPCGICMPTARRALVCRQNQPPPVVVHTQRHLAGTVADVAGAPVQLQLGNTLPSMQTLVTLVSALSWLPEQLGLPVPDAQAVVRSLLVGSVFCDAILPRTLAWLWCWLMWCRHHGSLPLRNPIISTSFSAGGKPWSMPTTPAKPPPSSHRPCN